MFTVNNRARLTNKWHIVILNGDNTRKFSFQSHTELFLTCKFVKDLLFRGCIMIDETFQGVF